jgi:YHS domain-containing protein
MRRSSFVLTLALAAFTALPALAGKSDDKSAKQPAIGGYCPVAYAAAGKALKGDAKYALTHKGQRYLFVSADAMKMFQKEPGKFAIGYDGWCATAMAMGQKVASDPALFTVHGGVSYLFSSAEAKAMFDADARGHVMKADGEWKKLSMKKS